MLDALWSIQFSSNATRLGGSGVVVIENGRILGGDMAYLFLGDVRVDRDTVKAKVHVKPYGKGASVPNVTGFSEYEATFEGKLDRSKMRLAGTVVGAPQIQVMVQLNREAELP